MANIIRPEFVRQGHDPDWRLGWEEQISAEERAEVKSALKQSRHVEDPNLRIYAEGLARRRLGSFRRSLAVIPLHVGLVAFWIYATCFVADPPRAWCWFDIAIGLLWLLVVPAIALRRYRTLKTALTVNSAEVAAGTDGRQEG